PTHTGTPTRTATPSPTPSPTPFPPIGPGLVEPYIPPSILKAIGWIESGWAQAAFSVAYGDIGPALISHDCGYGIMQVTTGMQNTTGQPTPEQLMAASHYAYNIARGTRILADKWNLAPEFRPIVGDRNPQAIEDWYYAVWSYNGFAFQNHPLNPRFPAWPRPSYSCGPFDDGFSHDRSQYPYQELVFGCMAHPPQPDGAPLWQPQEVALPDLSSVEFAEALKLENFVCDTLDHCYDMMDIPRPAGAHADSTPTGGDRSKVVGSPKLEVSTTNIELGGRPEGLSQPQVATISNSGTGILVWTATSSASWLQLSAAQGLALGTDLGRVTSPLTIQANMAGLPRGRYVGTITLEAPYAAGGPKTITVTVSSLTQSFVPGVIKS
ncbi:MAG: transglycosylase SLT domain-containing protein, partial [Chloroflexota bacterium]|nr:transglycosylase SLT domain-containing protein [Chloroflexota bacterium]